jgi:hypothetical protein
VFRAFSHVYSDTDDNRPWYSVGASFNLFSHTPFCAADADPERDAYGSAHSHSNVNTRCHAFANRNFCTSQLNACLH